MYAYEQANWLRRLMRLSGAVPPISWLYARTLHYLDRGVYRLSGRRRRSSRGHDGAKSGIQANPRATVEFDGVTRDVVARELAGDERERHYNRGIEIYPGWTQYRKRAAHRQIPVIELAPAS